MSAPGWDELPHQSALAAASPQAQSIEDLWWVFLWLCTGVWALVMLVTLIALLRRRPAHAVEPLVNPGPERSLVRVTGVATALTVIILLGLLFASARTGRALATTSPDALNISITGQRWWWRVEYPADMPSNWVTTANEVHVPVGRPVAISLESSDVIHSLWVPELHGKRDLIPGNTTELRFTVDRPGVYRGQCAEYCGLQHAHMGLLVVAEPPERFEAWLAAQRAPAAAPQDAEAQRGQQLFLGSSCPMCHGVRGTQAAASVGPDLTHVASRMTLAAATRPNTSAELAAWVRDPHAIKLGTLMPPNPLGPDDEARLVAYLMSLK